MLPTVGANQMVLVNTTWYDFTTPGRGDVVVFKLGDPKTVYIKRVIAVPGDRVQIYRGRVWLNGVPRREPYTKAPADYTMLKIPGTDSDRVPPGDYFVLGDNRPRSVDSHRWGLVPRSAIIGRAAMVYWPLDHFGWLW